MSETDNGGRSTTREYYEAILVAVIFALFVRTFVVQAFKIPTGSMEDNLLVGDHILVDKTTYGPRAGRPWDVLLPYSELDRGDVVVFKFPRDPARDFIKRCIALPGDSIEIKDRVVYINGEPRTEEPPVYFKRGGNAPYFGPNFPRAKIPDGGYFMMGDNRDNSEDSRYWGAVPRGNLKGRALLIYWSFDAPPQHGELSFREKIGRLADVAIHFFTKTRWRRTFDLIE